MTDLTDKWKKGELPECEYYIQDKDGNTSTMHLWNDERCKLSVRCKRLSILAPVPSYEEWQRILHYAGKYEVEYTSCVMDYENLKEKNTKLKELLKECKEYVKKDYGDYLTYSQSAIYQEINQALGEDK